MDPQIYHNNGGRILLDKKQDSNWSKRKKVCALARVGQPHNNLCHEKCFLTYILEEVVYFILERCSLLISKRSTIKRLSI